MDVSPVGRSTWSPAMLDAVNYHAWILARIRPHLRGAVLEIGLGGAQYTPDLARGGTSFLGVDCDAACLAALRATSPDLPTCLADLSSDSFAGTVGEAHFDVAVCLNVLEHILDDRAALERIAATLKPGGHLLLIVPAFSMLYGPMDRMAGHHRRYTRASLARVLRAAGFTLRVLHYFNPVGGLGWWVNARFGHPESLADETVARQILFYDRYLLPISRILDPLTRCFFGQSVWAVAQRAPAEPAKG